MTSTKPYRSLAVVLAFCASSCAEPNASPHSAPTLTQGGAEPVFGAVAFEEFQPAPPGGTMSELRRALPLLQAHGVALALHWKSDAMDDPQRWRVVDEALARGVPVYPVLTLPEGSERDEDPTSPGYARTGYYPNSSNYAAWIEASKKLMSAWRARHLPPTTMVVDMEMRKRRLLRLSALTGERTDPLGTLLLLSSGINRRQYAAALQAYRDYAEHAHALGFKVHLTTLLPMLDDYRDGDDSLRQAFGVPLDDDPRKAPWDGVSFQIHRTLYAARYTGLSSYFVYDYATEIKRLFGERAGVDVGLTHGGIEITAPLYATGAELRADVGAALAAGIPAQNIGVYSLIGMIAPDRAPVEQWFTPPASVRAPPDDGVTARSHRDWALLDTLIF